MGPSKDYRNDLLAWLLVLSGPTKAGLGTENALAGLQAAKARALTDALSQGLKIVNRFVVVFPDACRYSWKYRYRCGALERLAVQACVRQA